MTSRLLFILGRSVGSVAAALTVGSIAKAVFLFFRYGPDWNVGLMPLVLILQIIVAAWVVWGVLKLGPRPLLRVLLLAFTGSFLASFGWYFLLAGEGGELVAIGNLLYLVAGVFIAIGAFMEPSGSEED